MAQNKKRRALAASIGDCVHSLGVETFVEWMEDKGIGYAAVKLGPAVQIDDLINKIRESRPEVVGVSFRLGDLHLDKMITEFVQKANSYGLNPIDSGIRYVFGGLRPAANLVRAMTGKAILADKFAVGAANYDLEAIAAEYKEKSGFHHFFEMIVDDFVTMEELEEFADKKIDVSRSDVVWSDDLIDRINQVREIEGRPIIRAHIGIASESLEPTILDIVKVCEAEALEIVSLAPDQPCQAFLAKFIRGEEDPAKYLRGQGGAPIRSKGDLKALKDASLRGNYPMTRIYSGTDELEEMAHYFEEAFNMAFPAVPIFFYNQLDGRGPLSVLQGIEEHFAVMRWWASINKPLEINDPHQWQLRNCSDDMYVTDHLICGIVALKTGIKNYVLQLMFDLPPQIGPLYDLAKMKAVCELLEPLVETYDFNVIRETRGGLSSFPPNLYMAKGHLAISTHWQMFMNPDIVHVVSYPEAHHEAKAEDIIESCDIIKQVFKDFAKGDQPDIWADSRVQARKEELKKGATYNLLHLALMAGYEGKVNLQNFSMYAVGKEIAANRSRDQDKHYGAMIIDLVNEENYPGKNCGLISADNLDLALQIGMFQAPQITVVDKRYELTGKCRTRMVNACCRIDEFDGVKVKDEFERVDMIRRRFPWYFFKEVSMAEDKSFISELEEQVGKETVAQFRAELGIADMDNKRVLAVDFGSTYTKIAVFNTSDEKVDLKYVPTTPDDIRGCLANGLGCLAECEASGSWDALQQAIAGFDIKLPCSSAKGGLKMVTVSLTKEESGFAADLAALTAGAKLLNSYAGKLTDDQVNTIYFDDQPEIILLSGGVDEGGDSETQLHNAGMLAKGSQLNDYAKYGVPVIYAGNQDVADAVADIFHKVGVDIRITKNVMPEVNSFNIEAVNEVIRELFQTIIIRGKGFDVVEEYMSAKFLPTPRAAFLGINLLAKGFGAEEGIGNIVALDIGGCTTDFFANVQENPLFCYPWDDARRKVKRTILKTPNAPLAYRRVEGKYGLSYNAENLLELERFRNGAMERDLMAFFRAEFPEFRPGADHFGAAFQESEDGLTLKLEPYLQWIHKNPHHLPETLQETAVRSYLAREIMSVATKNNVGFVVETDTYFLQYGVNFYTTATNLLLIGGTIYHKCKEGLAYNIQDLKLITDGALFSSEDFTVLRPCGKVFLDASYLVSTVGGLYGRLDPERAIRIMKANLKKMEELEVRTSCEF